MSFIIGLQDGKLRGCGYLPSILIFKSNSEQNLRYVSKSAALWYMKLRNATPEFAASIYALVGTPIELLKYTANNEH
jgi:hypothetical protein